MSAAAKTWNVRPNRFPFGVASEILGVVTGVDREQAQKKAADHYGRDVVVELAVAGPNRPERSRVSRHAGNGSPRPLAGALTGEPAARRLMTADEAQMARWAASTAALRTSSHKATIRMLHARSLSADRTITDAEAQLLRAVVVAFKALLPAHIVALAEPKGGAS